MVFTALFHSKRGFCCGNKCKHCPYIPKYIKNTTTMDIEMLKVLKEQAEFLEKNQDSLPSAEKIEKAMDLYNKINELISNIDIKEIEQE